MQFVTNDAGLMSIALQSCAWRTTQQHLVGDLWKLDSIWHKTWTWWFSQTTPAPTCGAFQNKWNLLFPMQQNKLPSRMFHHCATARYSPDFVRITQVQSVKWRRTSLHSTGQVGKWQSVEFQKTAGHHRHNTSIFFIHVQVDKPAHTDRQTFQQNGITPIEPVRTKTGPQQTTIYTLVQTYS
jgi:hypothetical protein